MAISDIFFIDQNGVRSPSYQEILDDLTASFRAVFGNDINIAPDTQDGQELANRAKQLFDTIQAVTYAYTSLSPSTALTDALSRDVRINGISRVAGSYSTAQITITGAANTNIVSGLLTDSNSYLWALPASVIIPASGTITVTATCTTIGAITANANTIKSIYNPQLGWTSANNPAAATVGTAVETDAQLRIRQAVSTSLPSLGLLDGIVGNILNLANVTACVGYQNDTTSAFSNGIAANSIAIVVNGGANQDIWNVIGKTKSLGVGTNTATSGATVGTYTDSRGYSQSVAFFRSNSVPVIVTVNIYSFTNYTSDYANNIKTALANYLTDLPIGSVINSADLVEVASAVIGNSTFSVRSITMTAPTATPPVTVATDLIRMGFRDDPSGSTTNITVNVTPA